MNYKSIDKAEAAKRLDAWRENKNAFHVEEQYSELRDALVATYHTVKKQVGLQSNEKKLLQESYLVDLEFGLQVYEILGPKNDFSLRLASDDGVWRYLAVCVIPDIVADRWGAENNDHYWAKPGRNWLRQMWWYVYLSWNGSVDETKNVLKDNSTDEILNLIERAGRGYNVEVCRRIMYHYGRIPQNVRLSMKQGKGRTLFRTIMVMNTAYTQTIEPGLFKNKEEGYVRWLFANAGVPVE